MHDPLGYLILPAIVTACMAMLYLLDWVVDRERP